MHPVRKQRLILVLFVVLFSSAAIGLVVYALRGNINLFFPPAEVAAGKAPVGQPIRVGGMVVDGSVQRRYGRRRQRPAQQRQPGGAL
jgi:cytochrome c-type biogenesis protein CcmE